MPKGHKHLQQLVRDCGMTKPGVAQVLGINLEKVNRMYYGKDHILPGVIEAMIVIRGAQQHAREMVPSSNSA